MDDYSIVWSSVFALIPMALTAFLYFKNRTRKSISYSVVGGSFSTWETAYENRVQIYIEGQEVKDLKHFLIDIENSGNVPIKPDDYEESMTLSFENSATIYDCSILRTSPSKLQLSTEIDGNQISLGKKLLNPGDRILLGVLATSQENSAKLNDRIAGIKILEKEYAVLEDRVKTPILVYGGLLSALYFGFGLYAFLSEPTVAFSYTQIALDTMFLIFLCMFMVLFMSRRFFKK